MFASEHIDTKELVENIKASGYETELTGEQIIDTLDVMLDYYCKVEINGNYAAASGVCVTSGCIGEVEEPLEMITDQIPAIFSDTDIGDKVTAEIKEKLSAVYVHETSDCVYIDMSDIYASLVLREDRIEELLSNED